MKLVTTICFTLTMLSGCIVVPTKDMSAVNKCEISSDRKTLKIINGFEDTNTQGKSMKKIYDFNIFSR
jgi:hypothetical protein